MDVPGDIKKGTRPLAGDLVSICLVINKSTTTTKGGGGFTNKH